MFYKIKTIILALAAFAGFTSSFAMSSPQSNGIVIQDTWVRSESSNASGLGAFMKIHNNSNQNVKLISAYAEGYKDVQLHSTIDDGGMMRMVEQEFIPVTAKGKVHLKPGSWHVMLIKPEKVPAKGEVVLITLKFDNGSSQAVKFKVRKGKKNDDASSLVKKC